MKTTILLVVAIFVVCSISAVMAAVSNQETPRGPELVSDINIHGSLGVKTGAAGLTEGGSLSVVGGQTFNAAGHISPLKFTPAQFTAYKAELKAAQDKRRAEWQARMKEGKKSYATTMLKNSTGTGKTLGELAEAKKKLLTEQKATGQ